MCGRYVLAEREDRDLERHYNMRLPGAVSAHYNIRPSQSSLVVLPDHMEFKTWGMPVSFGNTQRSLINVRDDSLGKFWTKDFLFFRRCLVPANGWYEWKLEAGVKQPYYHQLPGGDLFSFAGLWTGNNFTIVTANASPEAAQIHPRMPAVLEPEEEEKWINPDNAELETLKPLIHPYRKELDIYKVSTQVNKYLDDPSLLKPLDFEQSSLI